MKALLFIVCLIIIYTVTLRTKNEEIPVQTAANISGGVTHDLPTETRRGTPHPHPYAYKPKGYPDDINNVKVEYTNIIRGMKVDVVWEPISIIGGYAVGEALINFTNIKDGTSFSIYNSSFGVGKNKVKDLNLIWRESEDNGYVDSEKIEFDRKTIRLEYELGSSDFGETNMPFFFYDLDFDNNKELIVVLNQAGQRWAHIYKVYAFTDGQLIDKQKQITDDEPYLSLDGRSTVNIEDKTIIINGSSGVCDNYSMTYSFTHPNNSKKNKYILEEYSLRELLTASMDRENTCYSYTYKIDKNREMKLTDRKKIR